jgi:hypothetical protein
VAIAAAVSWAALPASAQAGHGGPAGDPLTDVADAVDVSNAAVTIDLADAVAVDVSRTAVRVAVADAVAVDVSQTVTVDVRASGGGGSSSPAEPAQEAPPAEPSEDAEPGPSEPAPSAEPDRPVEQHAAPPTTPPEPAGHVEPAETRPAPEPAAPTGTGHAPEPAPPTGTGHAPAPAAATPADGEPRRERVGMAAPKVPPTPSVVAQLGVPAPPVTGFEPAPIPQPAAATASPPRAEPRAHRDRPQSTESPKLPYVDIAPPPTELPGTAGGQAAPVAATAAGLLVTLILLTICGITLRQRIAERRLSSLLWSTDIDRPG